MAARKKLGEMLIEAGVLTESALRAALVEQRRWGGTLGRTLVEMRQINEEELVRVLSAQLNLASVDLDKIAVPQGVIDLVTAELVTEFSVVPFAQKLKFLDVAMADPTNLGIIDELRIRTQLNIRPYLAGPKMIERAIARYYGRGFGTAYRHDIAIDMHDAIEPSQGVVHEGTRPFQQRASTQPPPPLTMRDAEIDALQGRLSTLEALVARDEEILRKLFGLLVEKGLATRDEILQRIG
jgi:type IV pilus assembly protein PilB